MMKAGVDKSKYVPITQEMIERLKQLKAESGFGYQELYEYGRKHTCHDVFIQTEWSLPNKWINNKSHEINLEHYNAIIETYTILLKCHLKTKGNKGSKKQRRKFPQVDKSQYVPITQDMIDQLVELKDKTGVGFHTLYKYGKSHTNHDVFRETTNTLPNHWVIGTARTVYIEYFNSIIETYSRIPQNFKSTRKTSSKKTKQQNVPDLILFTKGMLLSLSNEINRTGLGFKALWIKLENNRELQKFSYSQAQSWISKPPVRIDKAKYNLVLTVYKSLPDAPLLVRRDNEMLQDLRAEIARSRLSPTALWHDFHQTPEWEELGQKVIKDITQWQRTPPCMVNRDHFRIVMEAYKSLPTSHDQLIPLTKKMINHLVELRRNKCCSLPKLWGTFSDHQDLHDFNHYQAQGWISKSPKQINKRHYDLVISLYESLPDGTPSIHFTHKEKTLLISEIERTGLGIYALWNKFQQLQELDRFNRSQAQSWVSASPKRINKDYFDLVISLYKSLPDAPPLVKRDNEMLQTLRAEKARTRVSARELYNKFSIMPEWIIFKDTTISDIESWGASNSIMLNAHHFDAVIKAYNSLPDSEFQIVPISKKMVERLKKLKETTHFGFSSIYKYGLKHNNEIFKCFTEAAIYSWVSGATKSVAIGNYQAVIDMYEKLPVNVSNKPHTKIVRHDRRLIDECFKAKVAAIYERPQLKIKSLLKYSNPPKGITSQLIRNIAIGQNDTVSIIQYEYLNKLFQHLQDQGRIQ